MPGAVPRHSLRARFFVNGTEDARRHAGETSGTGHAVPIVGCDANAKRLLFFDP